jgi:hypothetical protein
MYVKEGDFQACVARIRAQDGVTVTHMIRADMAEKEAHNALWHGWREARANHDLFVKVDADTVLVSNHTLADIWALFAANPRVTGLQAPLHDYMTDGFINGLNSFSPRVVFNDTRDELYCDRVDTGHDVVLRGADLPASLTPAGYHCHRATAQQAFHFGLHRALKGQHDIIARVEHAYVKHHDRIRAFALLGARAAPEFEQHRRFNYGDAEFQALYNLVCSDYDQLISAYNVNI